MQFGIIGILAYISLICRVIYLFIKNEKNTDKTFLFVAIITIMLHSMLDFDMSFFYILIFFHSLIGLFDYEYYTNNKKENKSFIFIIWYSIISILICVALVINCKQYIAEKAEKIDTSDMSRIAIKNLNDLKLELAPYSFKYRLFQYTYLSTQMSNFDSNTIKEEKKELLENLISTEPINREFYFYSRLASEYINNIDENNEDEVIKKITQIYNRCKLNAYDYNTVTVANRIIKQLKSSKLSESKKEELIKTLEKDVIEIRDNYYK